MGKRESVDIVIRYEHKVRELESIMLIKIEMERRGYSVAFVANYDYKNKKRYEPKLIVSPAIYSDEQLKPDIAQYGLKKKIANLMWEQVMGMSEEESSVAPHNIFGTGQRIPVFCWGENTKRRLVAAGMPVENVKVVGQINTDLLKGPFRSLLATKEQLAKLYGINSNARWNLFVSSFAYCELDELQETLIRKVYGNKYFYEFTKISIQSRDELLTWFEDILERYPKDVMIYRPHPDELAKSERLKIMVSKYSNFHVIADLSLKHWCNAVDKVYNWYSTGIIDAVVLEKPYRILRPYHISKEYDYRLFYTASQIKTKECFLEDYNSLETTRGLNPQMISDYYYFSDSYVYIEICNILERMLNSENFDIKYTKEEKKRFQKVYFRAEFFRKIRMLSFCKPILKKLGLFKNRIENSEKRNKVLCEGFSKNVATEDELANLYNQLKPIVYGC